VEDAYGYYGVAPTFSLARWRRPAIGPLGKVFYGARVRRMVKERSLPALFYGRSLLGMAAVAGLGCPLIYEAHNRATGIPGRWLHGWLFRQPNFRRLVVTSSVLRVWYEAQFPELAGRVLVALAGGVDARPAPTPAGPEPASAWRGRAGRLQVGYTGHLYTGKGMEVVPSLARQLPEADFHVVGGNPEDVARWRRRLQDVPNLQWHGHQPPAATAAFVHAMDVLLVPAQPMTGLAGRRNGLRHMSSPPLKMFEYMVSGRPIVASDLPAIREALTDRRTALLVPPADLDAWTRAIRALGADAMLRQRLAASAQQDALARFTWDARARRVLEGIA
jgi:glycosyltransferase involved in cell wall biosynthesis